MKYSITNTKTYFKMKEPRNYIDILHDVMNYLFENIERGKEITPEDREKYRELYREYLNAVMEEAQQRRADMDINIMKDEGLL